MVVDLAERDRWVEEFCGIKLSGSRVGDPAPPATPPRSGRLIAFRTLLLRWRRAQSAVAGSLEEIGRTLMARDDVRADPRCEQVKTAVAALPSLVPTFGGRLEDALDAGINAGPGPDATRLAKESATAAAEYRRQLEATPLLGAMEMFAANDLGQSVALQRELIDALSQIEQQLSDAA